MDGEYRMNKDTINPFSIVKANDFTDQQIMDYWVDLPEGNGFLDVVSPLSVMPMILIGGKGSGKTHLMRYFSYPLQKIRYGTNFVKKIEEDKFLGMYLKCGGLNSEKFSGKKIDQEIWDQVFSYYFDIWIAQVVLETFIDIVESNSIEDFNESELCSSFLNCFDKRPIQNASSLIEVLDCLHDIQKKIDMAVNNCVFTGELDLEILVSPGKLFFGFPKIIEESVEEFQGVLFVYLIDELENLLEEQQVYIQTLVRDRVLPCSIKIGVRTYGIKTLRTQAAREENREGSEFDYVRLDQRLRISKENYKEFAIKLCIKRIKESQLISVDKDISIGNFSDFFESETSIDELSNVEGLSSGIDGKTIQKLINNLKKNKNYLIHNKLLNGKDFEKIPQLLAQAGLPILERFAVYSFYKQWYASSDLLKAAEEINSILTNYINDKSSELQFRELISKFKLDILAQLRKDNSEKQVYAGVDTLIDLSKGFPRSLLTICKHIYNSSLFNGEKPFVKDKISIESQVEGVRLSSMWYFEDSRIAGKDGTQLKSAVERLAELYRINRYSDKPSECSLRAFSANLADVSEETQRLITLASKWSMLLQDTSGRPHKNSERVDEKYILNPMLAPHWGLPVGIRGVLNLNAATLNSIFDPEFESDFLKIKNAFEKARNTPFGKESTHNDLQLGLLEF